LVQSGGIEGDVRAKEKAVLYKDADFYGTLQAPVMVVEEGARVKGQINMDGNDRELPAREPEAVESGEG
jgi:cytoskeletal protein CcmA (bactofilin family)